MSPRLSVGSLLTTLIFGVFAFLSLPARGQDPASQAGEPEELAVKAHDWCEITAPATVHAGSKARIEVSVHDASVSEKLHCHLYYRNEWGTPTGFVLYPPAQDLKDTNGVHVFSVSFPQVSDAAEIVPLVFISNDGTWEGQTKHGEGPRIGLEKWCSISAPGHAQRGGSLEIEVSLHRVSAPNVLAVNLLLLDENGKKVSEVYTAPADVSASESTHTFLFNLPNSVEASKARPLVFVSPNGKWEDKQLSFEGEDTSIDQ